MISTAAIHWMAGFVEGEGAFGHSNGSPSIRIPQNNREPLDKVANLFGGRVLGPYRTKTQPRHYWMRGGSAGAAIMMTIYPLMSEKRKEQIRIALEEWKTRPRGQRKMRVAVLPEVAREAVRQNVAGKSMSRVARELGVSVSTVWKWRHGKNAKAMEK